MSSNQREAKVYGAVETEDHITFTGFCKKIYSDEIQTVDVFIDSQKIDTIKADKSIKEIEDTYDIFDTNNFCFEYSIPENMIGDIIVEEHTISFKTPDKKNLLHSPSKTLSKNSVKYPEFKFLDAIKKTDNTIYFENTKATNTFGFFAIEENLKNKKFIDFILDILDRFENISAQIFYFESTAKKKIELILKNYNHKITYSTPKTILDITENINIFIDTYDKKLKSLRQILNNNAPSLLCKYINGNEKNISLLEYNNIINKYRKALLNELRLKENNSISNIELTQEILFYNINCETPIINMKDSIYEFYLIYEIYNSLKYNLFNRNSYILRNLYRTNK